MTERRFCWGFGSPEITQAKEKEKKIERVKRREAREEEKTLVALSVSILATMDFKKVEKAELKRSNVFKTSSETCIIRFTVSSDSKFKREQHLFFTGKLQGKEKTI